MDDEYQKKRREAVNRKPANVGSGLAQSGKGLIMVGLYIYLSVFFFYPFSTVYCANVYLFPDNLILILTLVMFIIEVDKN